MSTSIMLNQTFNPEATCALAPHLPSPRLIAAVAPLPAPRPCPPLPAPPSSRRRLTGLELAARLANPLAR